MAKQLIIFTDLDGTLLDHDTYSFKKAQKVISAIKKKKVPLVFCTSKTRAETEFWQKKMGLNEPFIVENGGAIFVPKNYFDFTFPYARATPQYVVIELGTRYKVLRKTIAEIKHHGFYIRGFGDMRAKDIADECGLKKEQAILAKQREYDEAFNMNENDEKRVKQILRLHGLNLEKGGRYYHIMGKNDKGKALKRLLSLFKRHFKQGVKTAAIGDSENDFKMLNAVDIPFLVQKKDKSYATRKYKKVKGIGPDGWAKAVKSIIK